MSSKVHSQGNVPFSWENKPGISKMVAAATDRLAPAKLTPPPCPAPPPPESARVWSYDLQVPLPPCPFQPPSRSSSMKGVKHNKMDDPFLTALKEVTKSTRRGNYVITDQRHGLMKNVAYFSCKQSSCSVAEDSVVRLSQLPHSKRR